MKEQQRTSTPSASEEVLGLVEFLKSSLMTLGLETFPETQAQFNGFKSLIAKYGLEDVADRLEWAMQSDFWQSVILTPLTFKKNYATIDARFKKDPITRIREWEKTAGEEQW